MGDVLTFGKTVLPGEANPDIVEILEKLLEEAKSGELRGLAYCTVKLNNVLGTGWAGSDGTRYLLGAATGMLAHRYSGALLESGEMQ